jgi:hypothetical protein
MIHIMDPWHHLNRLEQVIGRGIRYCSHIDLPEEDRNVLVFLHALQTYDNKKETNFERRVDIPVVLNARGFYPVGPDSQALTQAEAAAIGYTRTNEYPIAVGDTVLDSNFITTFGTGQNQLIPPGPTLSNGRIGILEPIKWAPMYRDSTSGALNTYNPSQIITPSSMKGSPCAFMQGQRAMYGFLKFSLNFGYVGATDPTDGPIDCPITVRMTVIKMNGKLIDGEPV